MDNMKKRTAAGTAMALVGGAFWGLSGVCGQYLFQTKEMTATWLVPVRLFVSGLLLLAFFLAKDAKRTLSVWKNKKTAMDLLIYSFAGIMLCQYAYFQTIEWSNAGTATVVQYIGPALIVVFVCITTHRKPLPKEIVAVVLALAGIFARAPQGHALIEGHVVAQYGGFADDHAAAVIDKQPLADHRAGMNIDAREALGAGADEPGPEKMPLLIGPVRPAMPPHRPKARIAEKHLRLAVNGGIPRQHGGHILLERFKHARLSLLKK